jgi:hypothetical protein
MSSVDRRDLDARPDESTIATLREEAAAQDASIEAHYPAGDKEKRLVVSPRGTVVVLNNVSEETFNQSVPAAEIAAQLRA